VVVVGASVVVVVVVVEVGAIVVVVVEVGAIVVVVVVPGAAVVVVVVPGAAVVVVVEVGARVVVVVVPVGPGIFPVQVVGDTVKLYVKGGGPKELTEPANVTNPQVLASFEVDGYLADILVVDPAVASSPAGDSCHVV
jgi:hypothetical protein